MTTWEIARFVGMFLPPLLGLIFLVLTRLSMGSSWQMLCQRGFFSCMLLLAGVMVAMLTVNCAITISYGASLAMMSVAAVWDSAPSRFVG